MAKTTAAEQAGDFFKKLSLVQKIVIGASIVAVFGVLFYIIYSTSEPPMAVLYSSLDESDAGKIVQNLTENNINYELKDKGTTILVEKESVNDQRIRLANEGLPETSNVGYEIFDRTNLGMSDFVQKLNYRRALEGELSKTISSLEEVKKARVHIVIPEKALFIKDQKTPTSSVTLHLSSGKSISKLSVEGIQNMVANSVEGMQPDDVTVVDQRGKILSEAQIDGTTIAGMTAQQLEQQRKVEMYLSDKVKSMLDGVLGYGNSEVHVNAELDFTQIEETNTNFDPDKQVVRSEQTINETSQSADSLSYPYVNMAKDQQNVISNYEISKNVEHIVHSTGGVKRLTVAAMVNGIYSVVEREEEKALEYNPRSEEEMQKLTEIVKNAVGYDPNRNDQVSVINFAFETAIDDFDPDVLQEVRWYEDPDNRRIIILAAIILISAYLMYRLLSSKAIRERVRIAMALPEKIDVSEEEIEEDDEDLDEIDLDEEELLLLPADLPEQLLLESERREEEDPFELEGMPGYDSRDLADMASAEYIEPTPMSEDAMLKLELKNKVEDFLDSKTEEAVKMIRLLIATDYDQKNF